MFSRWCRSDSRATCRTTLMNITYLVCIVTVMAVIFPAGVHCGDARHPCDCLTGGTEAQTLRRYSIESICTLRAKGGVPVAVDRITSFFLTSYVVTHQLHLVDSHVEWRNEKKNSQVRSNYFRDGFVSIRASLECCSWEGDASIVCTVNYFEFCWVLKFNAKQVIACRWECQSTVTFRFFTFVYSLGAMSRSSIWYWLYALRFVHFKFVRYRVAIKLSRELSAYCWRTLVGEGQSSILSSYHT